MTITTCCATTCCDLHQPALPCNRYDGTCFSGFDGLVSAFLFAVETQQTIGEDNGKDNGIAWFVTLLVLSGSAELLITVRRSPQMIISTGLLSNAT